MPVSGRWQPPGSLQGHVPTQVAAHGRDPTHVALQAAPCREGRAARPRPRRFCVCMPGADAGQCAQDTDGGVSSRWQEREERVWVCEAMGALHMHTLGLCDAARSAAAVQQGTVRGEPTTVSMYLEGGCKGGPRLCSVAPRTRPRGPRPSLDPRWLPLPLVKLPRPWAPNRAGAMRCCAMPRGWQRERCRLGRIWGKTQRAGGGTAQQRVWSARQDGRILTRSRRPLLFGLLLF